MGKTIGGKKMRLQFSQLQKERGVLTMRAHMVCHNARTTKEWWLHTSLELVQEHRKEEGTAEAASPCWLGLSCMSVCMFFAYTKEINIHFPQLRPHIAESLTLPVGRCFEYSYRSAWFFCSPTKWTHKKKPKLWWKKWLAQKTELQKIMQLNKC